MAVNTDFNRQIRPAIERNLPFQELSLASTFLTTGSQNCIFLGLPPTSTPDIGKEASSFYDSDNIISNIIIEI